MAVFPCRLNTLIALDDYVVTESTNCKTCDKPAKQSCSHCNVHYCSKVYLCDSLLTSRTVKEMVGNKALTSMNVV